MAKSKKTEEPKKEQKSIKTKKFTLKREFQGKAPGDTIEVGKKGERILKSKNII